MLAEMFTIGVEKYFLEYFWNSRGTGGVYADAMHFKRRGRRKNSDTSPIQAIPGYPSRVPGLSIASLPHELPLSSLNRSLSPTLALHRTQEGSTCPLLTSQWLY